MPLRQLLFDTPTVKALRYAPHDRHGLVLPALAGLPAQPAVPSLWERLTGGQLLLPPHWSTQTLTELIDWVVAYNYEKLLRPPFASSYEVAQTVIGLTSDKVGGPIEETQLGHSFINDLGMD